MNVIPILDGLQRGFISSERLRGDFLFNSILKFKCNSDVLEKRRDLKSARCQIGNMDLVHNRLLMVYSENLVRIHDMNPPECQLSRDESDMKLMTEWKRVSGITPYEEVQKNCTFACAKFRRIDCGMFTISGESGSIGLVDTERLELICELGSIQPNVIYEHTFSPCNEVLIGAVGAPNNLHIVDLRLGSISLVLEASCGRMASIAWSPVNEYKIITGGTRGEVLMWDMRLTRKFLRKNRFVKRSRKDFFMPELKFDKNGNHLMLFSSDGTLRSLCPDTLDEKYVVKDLKTRWGRRRFQFDFETRSSPEIMFLPSGKSVAVFSANTGKQLATLRGHNFPVTKALYNEEKNEVYSTGGDLAPIIWASVPSKFDFQEY